MLGLTVKIIAFMFDSHKLLNLADEKYLYAVFEQYLPCGLYYEFLIFSSSFIFKSEPIDLAVNEASKACLSNL